MNLNKSESQTVKLPNIYSISASNLLNFPSINEDEQHTNLGIEVNQLKDETKKLNIKIHFFFNSKLFVMNLIYF